MKEIEERYAVEIEDVVELLGNKISRKEIDEKMNDILNTRLEDLFQYPDTNEPEKQEGYTQEDVEAIFDKITKGGMASITEDEKRILDDYSKKLN